MNKKLLCFGEVLWDRLPSGTVIGGAPLNFTYHANKLGLITKLISRVGHDELGDLVFEFLSSNGLETNGIQIDSKIQTGTVDVILDNNGIPKYTINQPAAWDNIMFSNNLIKETEHTDALIFGSLSTRHPTSRGTLLKLLETAKFKIFDINLREPFIDKDLILELSHKSDLIKMNDEELPTVGAWLNFKMEGEDLALELRNHFNCQELLVTLGARGSWSVNKNGLTTAHGKKVMVKDTVGCGDAFLAAYLSQYFSEKTTEDCLLFANKIARFIATQKGATPIYTADEILD